jgi:hypothetical protein
MRSSSNSLGQGFSTFLYHGTLGQPYLHLAGLQDTKQP